jgi:peptidase E
MTIVSLGGGGFTQETDPELDDLVLSLCPKQSPRLGFIGTASNDDPLKIKRFYARFSATGITLSHWDAGLNMSGGEVRDWVLAQDIIYVGGGDTKRLLDVWRACGMDEHLASAVRQGTVLAGVSAGGVCWFEAALSDSGGAGLAPLAGLALIPGSCCPHYSSEPARAPAFSAAIGRGGLPAGIAIDDGVAVISSSGKETLAVSARVGRWAYTVKSGINGVKIEPLGAYRDNSL